MYILFRNPIDSNGLRRRLIFVIDRGTAELFLSICIYINVIDIYLFINKYYQYFWFLRSVFTMPRDKIFNADTYFEKFPDLIKNCFLTFLRAICRLDVQSRRRY